MSDFFSFVDTSPGHGPNGDCHLWIGPRLAKDYGAFGRRLATHVALEMDGRHRPSRTHGALHSCDNPRCVSAAHLRWGTQRENARDASARLRYPNATKTHCPKGHEYTEENTIHRTRAQGWKDRHCRQCDKARKVIARQREKENRNG